MSITHYEFKKTVSQLEFLDAEVSLNYAACLKKLKVEIAQIVMKQEVSFQISSTSESGSTPSRNNTKTVPSAPGAVQRMRDSDPTATKSQ